MERKSWGTNLLRIDQILRAYLAFEQSWNSQFRRFSDVYEGIDDFLSFRISKVARIEDVYEGFHDFWTILEFLGGGERPKPAREYILGIP